MQTFISGESGLNEIITDSGATIHIGVISVGIKVDDIRIAEDLLAFYDGFPFTTNASLPDFEIELRHFGFRKPNHFQMYTRGKPMFAPFHRTLAIPYFDSAINWFLGWHHIHYLLIHAAVAERDGFGILLPAASGAGKSTLVAALVGEGWRFLSDEVAIVSFDEWQVWPHPRPISLKNDAIELIAKRYPNLADFKIFDGTVKGRVGFIHAPDKAIREAKTPILPQLVIFPKYVSDLHERNHISLDKADAFTRLVKQSPNYVKLLHMGFSTLASLVERCDHYELNYPNLDSALSGIEQLAGQHPHGR